MMKYLTYTMPRQFGAFVIPIAIQSCYIRDYCTKNSIDFSLPQTEMITSGCFSALKQLIKTEASSSITIVAVSLQVFTGLSDQFVKEMILSGKEITVVGALEMKTVKIESIIKYLNDIREINSLAINGIE